MKIVITTKNGEGLDAELDPRFGRCEAFLVVDSDSGKVVESVPNQERNAAHGAGIGATAKVAELGAEAVISGRFGPKAASGLKAKGIKMLTAPEGKTAREVLEMFKAGDLQEQVLREYR